MRFSGKDLPILWIVLLLSIFISTQTGRAQGILIPGAGPINRSMAGAATAAPLDAAGSLYWNPATMTGLESSEAVIGVELLYPRTKLTSTVAANSAGPGVPAVTVSGTDSSDSGVSTLPTTAIVYKPEGSRLAFGFGAFTVAGFGVNYPANPGNPVVSPPPPTGFGIGDVFSQLAVIQMTPNVAWQINDYVSIGAGPTFATGELRLDPGVFAAPDDADGDGFASFPSANNARWHWGMGFQAGMFVNTPAGWNFGAAIRSPQWFESFTFDSSNENGAPRTLRLDLDLPMIVSLGTAYTGWQRIVIAVDARWVDYQAADGFGDPAGLNPDGSATGLGWESVFTVATGIQYAANDRVTLRLGYFFTENPIPDSATSFNVLSSAIYEHALFLGSSVRLTSAMTISIAYLHAFENSIGSPIQTPLGPLPNSSVEISQVTDSLMLGFQIGF